MLRTGILFLVGLLLIGCDTRQMAAKKISDARMTNIKSVESVVSDKLNDIERMERCQRELEALKKIDIKIYDQKKMEFDKVMHGASIYNGVRSDVGIFTQNAVDAYYRYRVDKMCADISKNVLDSLSDNK
ncbi:TPA: hypothetical protein ACGS6U_002956 [Escherichia coli]